MKHDYAAKKLSQLLRDLDQYTADEFRRQMARIIGGATGQDVPDDCHLIKSELDAAKAQVTRFADAYITLLEKYDRSTEECNKLNEQLKGIADEVSDFGAALDGMLVTGMESDEIYDDLQARLSHFGLGVTA